MFCDLMCRRFCSGTLPWREALVGEKWQGIVPELERHVEARQAEQGRECQPGASGVLQTGDVLRHGEGAEVRASHQSDMAAVAKTHRRSVANMMQELRQAVCRMGIASTRRVGMVLQFFSEFARSAARAAANKYACAVEWFSASGRRIQCRQLAERSGAADRGVGAAREAPKKQERRPPKSRGSPP